MLFIGDPVSCKFKTLSWRKQSNCWHFWLGQNAHSFAQFEHKVNELHFGKIFIVTLSGTQISRAPFVGDTTLTSLFQIQFIEPHFLWHNGGQGEIISSQFGSLRVQKVHLFMTPFVLKLSGCSMSLTKPNWKDKDLEFFVKLCESVLRVNQCSELFTVWIFCHNKS